MGLFGRKRVAGISKYELEHDRVMQHLDSVFPSHYSSSKVKRAALHTALDLALDRDSNMPSSQKRGVIQREEFESILKSLEEQDVISSDEAEKLRKVAEKPLKD